VLQVKGLRGKERLNVQTFEGWKVGTSGIPLPALFLKGYDFKRVRGWGSQTN